MKKIIFMMVVFIVGIGILPSVVFSAGNKCVRQPLYGNTVEACDRSAKKYFDSPLLACQSTAGLREISAALIVCSQAILDKEFGKREKKIKKSNSSQLEREKRLKEAFENSLGPYCLESTDCSGGTMDLLNYDGCKVSLMSYVIKQFVRLNHHYLTFDKYEKKLFKNLKLVEKHFGNYTRSFCSLPKTAWKRDQIPSECERKVISEIASFASPDCPPPWEPDSTSK